MATELDDINEQGEILTDRSLGCPSFDTFLGKQESIKSPGYQVNIDYPVRKKLIVLLSGTNNIWWSHQLLTSDINN